jgi:hypothetical protein
VWRLRGSTQWPAFVAATLLDGLILDALPPLSTRTLNFVDGVLIATFGNLFLLAAVAPFLAKRLMRRRALGVAAGTTNPPVEAEREVLQDRVATIVLGVGVLACLVSGLANRPLIVSDTNATQEAARQMDIFVHHSGSAELLRNNQASDTVRLGDGYFRVCVPRDDRKRFVCIFVDTTKDPVKVRRDPSSESNRQLVGPNGEP